jgi:uncharacterized Ntn-hydrolase superfamily protein
VRVPHAKLGIGVIATQAYTNVIYGIKELELLMKGLPPQKALRTLLGEDADRNLRQVATMDLKRGKAFPLENSYILNLKHRFPTQ